MRERWSLILVALLASVASWADAPAGKHRFLAMDESRARLHYVDQADPSRNWTLALPARFRDMQLVGRGRVLVSTASGYAEYDLGTRELVKEVKDARFAGSASVRRLANGHTIIGCNQKGITFFELDANDQVLTTAAFPTLNTLRLFRLSPRGTLLFGANTDQVVEADLRGNILRQLPLAGARHIYQVMERPNGNLLVAAGYASAVVELDRDGNVVRKLGGKPAPEGVGYHFFAGMQVLKNGDTVVCNWTGHGAQDSAKAPQLLQFSPDGRLVWQWHDPALAGTLHGVILLDDLDPSLLHDDTSSVLGPVR